MSKFLDYAGVMQLWKRLSLEDYPNNETLIAVINAIDEQKADKDTLNDYYLKSEADVLHTEVLDYVDTEVAALVNSAPETLDTLGELAAAFQENEEVVDILNEAIATKYSADNQPPYPVTSVQGLTGAVSLPYETWTFTLNNGSTVTKKVVVV